MTRRFHIGRLSLVFVSIAACRAGSKPPEPVEARQSALALCSQTPLAVTAGAWHNCALLPDHTVECWGNNFYGQLGDGTTTASSVPRPVAGLANVTAVSAGISSTCALLSNGHVTCWGNTFGTATVQFSTTPVEVAGLNNATAVSARGYVACALLATGTVQCWGTNTNGTVGDGTTVDRAAPVDVTGLANVTAIDTGLTHACALIAGGGVKCWGDNSLGELGDGTTTERHSPVDVVNLPAVAQIATGEQFTCAALADGTARCWGFNADGELGDGTGTSSPTPVVVQGLTGVAQIAPGASHACAGLVSGGVRCWGYNGQGQLGDGTTKPSLSPASAVQGVGGAGAVAAGFQHSCALGASGVRCWGLDDVGELGNGTMTGSVTPAPVAGLASGVTQLSTGYTESCVLRADGSARCWGENLYGGLGVGTTTISPTPLPVSGLPGAATQIGVGRRYHACAHLADGSVWCWGYNGEGELGDGTTTQRTSPVQVQGLPPITALSVGGYHTCAATSDGSAWCWGYNGTGALGDPSVPQSLAPNQVPGLSGVTAISAGTAHTCAVTTGGTAICWGDNDSGQIGDGSNVERDTPTPVSLPPVAAIVAGGDHTCAVMPDRTLRCWGSNWAGQLGDGTTTDSSTPVTVSGLTNVAAVSLGEWHTCALTTGGTVSCWGHNSSGQLGDGTWDDAIVPRAVPSLAGATSIASGGYFTCALLAGGAARCWGDHAYGELGTGVAPGISTSVDVACAAGAGIGQACAGGGDCATGFCVDGVCCESACGGGDPSDCQACSLAAGSSADGTCAALPATRVCRPSAGPCDVAETCDGAGLSCPADAVVPGCNQVPVPVCTAGCTGVSIDLQGGKGVVGGITVTFSNVTSPGEIAMVQTGTGPPPPTGYQITGFTGTPVYWNIDTTASYTGPITVCIHYDQASINKNESLIRLVHDDGVHLCGGSAFCNITTPPVDTTNNIICGTTTSLSPFAIIEPIADTAPVFAAFPPTVVAYATSTAGAGVAYAIPKATDDLDPTVPVNCAPASGSLFAPGQTPVTCTAVDTSGNTATASFTVWVQYQAPTDGMFFLAPIRPDGSSVFRIGRAVPVKFRLTGASAGITDLVARLIVTRTSDRVRGSVDCVGDEDGEDTDMIFKYRKLRGIYGYRWKTGDQTPGTYHLRADLGDGVAHEVDVSLKQPR